MLSDAQLADAIGCPIERAARWNGHLTAAMRRNGITTRTRASAFLAQIGHESASLARTVESLNYSAERLLAVFPRHFAPDEASAYARQPQRIANRVYGSRLGNGPEASGDGWRYRGRGLIQITGRANYADIGALMHLPLVDAPDLLAELEYAAESAAVYWRSRGCNALADAGDFDALTRRINGGLNGQADRHARWERAKRALDRAA